MDRRGFDLERPGGLAKLRRLRDTLPKVTKKNIYNACTGIATLRLLLCALAGMWESTPAKSGEDPELWNETHLLKTPRNI